MDINLFGLSPCFECSFYPRRFISSFICFIYYICLYVPILPFSKQKQIDQNHYIKFWGTKHIYQITCPSTDILPPASDSATHWPNSGQSALIPSSSKELFFLALFWKSVSRTESTRPAEKKDIPPVIFYWTLQHWRSSPKITAATCNTLLLPATLVRPATLQGTFLFPTQVYFLS